MNKPKNPVDPKYLGIPNICFSIIEPNDTSKERNDQYKKQRIERGFDDSETWNLDATIASFILPRLKRFKVVNRGYPPSLTEEEWNNIIDKMIFSFEYILDDSIDDSPDSRSKKYEQYKEGIKLFAEYFHHLWW